MCVCVCVCVCVYWRGVSYLGHSVKKSAIKFDLKTDRPSRGRSLTLDVLWIGPLGLRIGQAVCYLHVVADSIAPKSARTVIPTAQWERGSGRTGHPPGHGGQCGVGLLCGTHVLPITPFCILPLLIHSKLQIPIKSEKLVCDCNPPLLFHLSSLAVCPGCEPTLDPNSQFSQAVSPLLNSLASLWA